MARYQPQQPQNSPANLFADRSFQIIMVIIGAVFLYVFQAPEKSNAAMSDVREKLATIVTGLSATREDIGKLSAKLDSTADGLADTKAEVAGLKAAQTTQDSELDRLRELVREQDSRNTQRF